ncbi:MAG TPA: hypothetical protein VK111_10200 [Virgibacillus sp.]|nr:hypothetical protein [Virgibacillus sp.]
MLHILLFLLWVDKWKNKLIKRMLWNQTDIDVSGDIRNGSGDVF